MTKSTTTVSAQVSSPKARVGLFARHANKDAFLDAAEELQAAVESGAIKATNVFYAWVTNPETLAAIDELVPGDVSEPAIGFEAQWGTVETRNKVRNVLNKRVPLAGSDSSIKSKAETIAAFIAGASVPDYRNLDEEIQEKMKSECLAWVRANSSQHGIFVCKAGRGGGTYLARTLELESSDEV